MPLPDRIQNAPELHMGLEFYYSAFLDLTSCRAVMEGPISWLSTDEYATRLGLSDEQREDLLYHIARMDKTFLDFHTKKREKDMAVHTKKPIGRKR